MKKHALHWAPDAVVYDLPQLRDWIFGSEVGEKCIYHIGQILVDQKDRKSLRGIADYAALMSDYGAVLLNQKRVEAGMYQYFASRTNFPVRTIPKAVANLEIEVRMFVSVRAVHQRAADMSARRVIRDILSCSEDESAEILKGLFESGLLTKGRPPKITDKGKGVLV